MMMVCVFSRCFPGVSPVNLNPRIVYNHMDAVLMCHDWDPDPPNILEGDKVMFFALNYSYINAISEQDTVWLCHSWGHRLFTGGKFTEVLQKGLPLRWFIFITNTQWVKVFCRCQRLFYRQKCDEESVGQVGEHIYLLYFFPRNLPKTVTVTALLLFDM